jgi:GNAT superfamily N-acetyltransferase
VGYVIRAAEPGEEVRVIPLYEWLFAPPGLKPPSWDERRAAVALRQAIESHDSAVIVAEDEAGELVGFCTVYQDMHSVRFGYRAWVEDLAVHPARRSEGIGKAVPRPHRDGRRAAADVGARQSALPRLRGLPAPRRNAGDPDRGARADAGLSK